MTAAFVLGEVCAAGEDGAWAGAGLAAMVLSVWLWKRGMKEKYAVIWKLLLPGICLLAGAFRFTQEENRRVEASLLNTQVELRGRVDWIQETAYGRRIILSQAEIYGVEQTGFKLCVYISSEEMLYPGDKIQMMGLLEEFERAGNPGEFDSLLYYRSIGCQYSVTVTEITAVRTAKLPVYRILMAFRGRMRTAFREICTPGICGVYQAMLLGDKTELSPETRKLYSESGISHILAISGIHIAVLGMGLYRLCRKFGGFGSSGLAAGGLIWLYVMMTGSAVSASRAGIMFVMQLFSYVCKRSYDMLSAAAAALLILLWQNPYYIYNSACQLSFGAVFAIGALYPLLVELFEAEKPVYKTLLSSVAVSLVTFPILSWSFFEISPYSVLLNLLIIPCMTLVMLSGILGGAAGSFYPQAGRFFIALGQMILKGYEWLCKGMRILPGSRLVTGRPEPVVIAVYYILLVLCSLSVRWALQREVIKKNGSHGKQKAEAFWKKGAVVGWLLIFPWLLTVRSERGFQVCFLDVSQGDGIYFETPEGLRVLVDGGSADKKKLYEYSLLPFLKYQGVRELDFAIVTHPDEDHISGLKELLKEGDVRVKQLLLPEVGKEMQDEAYRELAALAEECGASVGVLSQGDRLQHGKLVMTCLYPYEGIRTEDRNSYSTVLEVCYGTFSMLLTGDINHEGEVYLVNQVLDKERKYDVLKVAHHGSRFSTGEEFLAKVKAKYAVISCGKRNSYGHPHEEVIKRLEAADTEILITAEQGAVMMHPQQ